MASKPSLFAEFVAEFLGTFVLILFGTGVVAMVALFPTRNPGETIHGGFTNITLGWGLAVTMGIYVAGKISGAHLNPAITLSLAVFRDFPWRKVLPYTIAQTAGAFAAAAVVFWNYLPAFRRIRSAAPDHSRRLHDLSRLPRSASGRLSRSVDRHGITRVPRIRYHRRAQHSSRIEPRSPYDWPGGGGHRYELRRNARLRDQPSQRLWPAAFYGCCRISKQWSHRRKPRLVGSDRRTSDRRTDRRRHV